MKPPRPVTSRYFFGLFSREPGTNANFDGRYVTVVDYAPDASEARNDDRMTALMASWHTVIHGEDQWEDPAVMDDATRATLTEHARFEYGPADIRDRHRFRQLYQEAIAGEDSTRLVKLPTDDERRPYFSEPEYSGDLPGELRIPRQHAPGGRVAFRSMDDPAPNIPAPRTPAGAPPCPFNKGEPCNAGCPDIRNRACVDGE